MVRGGQWEAEGGLPRRPRYQRDRGLRNLTLAARGVRYDYPFLVGLLTKEKCEPQRDAPRCPPSREEAGHFIPEDAGAGAQQ